MITFLIIGGILSTLLSFFSIIGEVREKNYMTIELYRIFVVFSILNWITVLIFLFPLIFGDKDDKMF